MSTAASSSFMARIRTSSGLEIAKVSLLRTFIHSGEHVVGTLDFRVSSVAAAAAFGMNSPGLYNQTYNDDRTNNTDIGSEVSIDPYVCSQYSVSLVTREKIIDNQENIDGNESSLLSVDLPTCTATMVSKSYSMEQISTSPRPPARSPRKKASNNSKKEEVETIKSTYGDVVVGTDVVGFKLPPPNENSVPTFNSHIGI